MPKRLYRGKGTKRFELRKFNKRYGAKRGKAVWGAVIGKVAREQAAATGRTKIEWVKRHKAHSVKGRPFIVRRHPARVPPPTARRRR